MSLYLFCNDIIIEYRSFLKNFSACVLLKDGLLGTLLDLSNNSLSLTVITFLPWVPISNIILSPFLVADFFKASSQIV